MVENNYDGRGAWPLWAACCTNTAHINIQQETQGMSSTTGASGGTLDGMTIAQLRELAERAEATAKQKEADEKAKQYVDLGKGGAAGFVRRVRRVDGGLESRDPKYPMLGWENLYESLTPFIWEHRGSAQNLGNAAEILKQLADKGGFK